jgi:DNA replication protein DnaC
MEKFVSCGKCEKGYIYSKDRSTVKKCDCLKNYQERMYFQLNLKKADIENFNKSFSDYKGKDENNNISKLKKYTDNLTLKFKLDSHLYFYGGNGTQKTTLSKVILLEAIKKNLSCRFILMNTLMNSICSPIQEDENKELVSFLEICDLLVIDDCFSAKKVTLYKNSRDYQMSFLDSFLRKRLEQNKKNTIFTSNVSITDIEANGFSYDIQNLLERSIYYKGGQLTFKDVYLDNEHDINIDSMWN